MAAETRLYLVVPKIAEADKPIVRRLIRAATPAQALRHVASEYSVTTPTQDELIALGGAGVKPEDTKPDAKEDA